MFSYKPLKRLLFERGLKQADLVEKGITTRSTLAKTTKNKYISLKVIDDICEFLNCEIGDVVEHIKQPKDIKKDETN